MTAAIRTAGLPFDHLLAELAAFPVASEAALSNPITHLDPQMVGSTGVLWRAAECELLTSAPSISIDDFTAMRDGCWFGHGGRTPRSLQSFLRDIALGHLEYIGGAVAPRRPRQLDGPIAARPAHAQARCAWMWLTFALPEDLLLAMGSRGDWVPKPDLLTPAVRDLLSRGFAETHLHVGASLEYRTVWSLIQGRLSSPGLAEDELAAPGAALREGRDLPAWLIRAAIARVVLAGFLAAGARDSLTAYVHSDQFRGRIIQAVGVGTFSLILSALTDLLAGRLTETPQSLLRHAYSSLIGTGGARSIDTVDEAWAVDPIGPLLGGGQGSPEQILAIRLCAYLDRRESVNRPDIEAGQLFWQVVRVRNLFYRHFTQRPLTPGLPWFIRFYSRMARARGFVSTPLLMESAANRCGQHLGLTSLEMRTSPADTLEELRSWVHASRSRHGILTPELGLVFHFVKTRGGDALPGVPRVRAEGTTADPGANSSGFRFGDFFATQWRAATTLALMLHRWPRTLMLVRGLDLCSDELAVPAWVMKPIIDHIRQASVNGARFLTGLRGDQAAPLRMTVHAGEDFSHLLTGLRQIDQTIETLELREGDRIGHGLALGIEPARWAARVGRVALPLEDRVMDLAWEWTWWTRRGHGADAARLAYIAREVAAQAQDWFGRPLDALAVEQLVSALNDSSKLAQVGFPNRDRTQAARDTLIFQYLTDQATFERGRRTVWVEPGVEIDALERIASSLRKEVSRRGLAIEINPTSNLLIGDLSDLENHPLWRLSSPRGNPTEPRLAITVGSDDPLIFNSSLPMEYQLLFDSLLLGGLTDAETLAWLERVRKTSLERRFTCRHDAEGDLFSDENTAPFNPGPFSTP